MSNGPFDRRAALIAGAAVGVGFASRSALALRPTSSAGALSFEEFLALANPLAKELVGDTSAEGQDRYLLALAAVAVRMKDVPVPEMRETVPPDGKHTYLGFNPGGEPFNVLHWKLDPGATIRDHPHLYGNVVTLLLEGEVRIRHHELVGARDYDTAETFEVRRTCEQVLRPGGVDLVSLERNWTHGFLAGPAGARGLDITTRIRERRDTPVLRVEREIDAERGIFEARWDATGGE
jgi:hypothetical protein